MKERLLKFLICLTITPMLIVILILISIVVVFIPILIIIDPGLLELSGEKI